MSEENKNFIKEDEDFFQTKEDLFQKSLHGEADFYKGLERFQYKSVWSFFFAFLIALFVLFGGLMCISILIASTIAAVQQKVSSFIFGAIIVFLLGVLLTSIAFKLLRKLVRTFTIKDRDFKVKAIMLLVIPIALYIFIFVLILSTIFTMNITFY
jgi:hypothetical protein